MIELSAQDQEKIVEIADIIIGSNHAAQKNTGGIFVANIVKRMRYLDVDNLQDYLDIVLKSKEEEDFLISAFTIHTTSWFREIPHFYFLSEYVEKYLYDKKIRVFSAACSTGEEAYSLALHFEFLKTKFPSFDYEINAIDIDPVSIEKARNCLYNIEAASNIPDEYKKFLLKGTGKSSKYFTISKTVRDKISFAPFDLLNLGKFNPEMYDLVICRNVLIYFSEKKVDEVVRKLVRLVRKNGLLITGHVEPIHPKDYGMITLRSTCYKKSTGSPLKSVNQSDSTSIKNTKKLSKEHKLLAISNDNILMKLVDEFLLETCYDLEVNPGLIESKIDKAECSIIILDYDSALPRQINNFIKTNQEIPILVVGSGTQTEADVVLKTLELGARDYLPKAILFKEELKLRLDKTLKFDNRLLNGSMLFNQNKKEDIDLFYPRVILAGASTGGTRALTELFSGFPESTPPIVIVQHIPSFHAKDFAIRFCETTGLQLGIIEDDSILLPGHVYMSLNDNHIGINEDSLGRLNLFTSTDPLMNGHRPSVNFLFNSACQIENLNAYAILLTGMGDDGAQGLLKLRTMKTLTFAESEKSAMVYGMPRQAINSGAACFVGDLTQIKNKILLGIGASN